MLPVVSYANADSTLTPNLASAYQATIGVELGSIGYGINTSLAVNNTNRIQVGWTRGNIAGLVNDEFDKSDMGDVTFNIETDLNNPYISLQTQPLNNMLTVNAGVMYIGNNKTKATAVPEAGSFLEIDNTNYTTQNNAQIDINVEFKNSLAPYLTVGANSAISNKFNAFAEAGLTYMGGYNVDVDLTGDYSFNNQSTLLSDVEKTQLASKIQHEIEHRADSRHSASWLVEKWFPVVKVGVETRF